MLFSPRRDAIGDIQGTPGSSWGAAEVEEFPLQDKAHEEVVEELSQTRWPALVEAQPRYTVVDFGGLPVDTSERDLRRLVLDYNPVRVGLEPTRGGAEEGWVLG
eukprot:RCo048841